MSSQATRRQLGFLVLILLIVVIVIIFVMTIPRLNAGCSAEATQDTAAIRMINGNGICDVCTSRIES